MIRSMTGFGEASCQVGGAHYFLEIRSLNSKYFKAVLRLPEELQGLEAELESELRHRLSRGSVFMSVKHSDSSAEAAYRINDRALERYIEQIRKVPQIAKGDVELDIASLLTLPGVLQPPSDEEQRLAAARGVLKTLVAKACDALLAMREKEGRLIHKELMAHREEISQRIRLVSARSPKVMTEYESRLKAKIQQMIEELGVAVETVDIVREIAIAAERVDTAEEIARLSGHIDQFAELLSDKDPKPIGRTLDFLTQEMLREANTIASKCNDAEIARWTVEIKGAIDRIKEQVQNVE
ncbi:MAG TPA: YicC family protein [Phycisphaerales bacterium]|nr:YicC family protein [Phycisphaerales bacterium]